jgi:hypothetical protein
MTGSKRTPRNFTTPKASKSSAVIKKGSKEGNTTSAHILNPRRLASSASSGKVISKMVKHIAAEDNIIVLRNGFNRMPPKKKPICCTADFRR